MKISHFAMKVRDMNQAIHFYEKILGLTLLKKIVLPKNQGTLAYLKGWGSDAEIELFQEGRDRYEEKKIDEKTEKKLKKKEEKRGRSPSHEFLHWCLEVPDMESYLQEVAHLGVQIRSKPVEVRPGLRIAFLRDPGGIDIEIMERSIGEGSKIDPIRQ